MMTTIAVDFAFYGTVQVELSITAIIILAHRRVPSRWTKAAILSLLLSSSTSTFANIKFYLTEFPSYFGSSERDVDVLLLRLGIVITVAQDFNVHNRLVQCILLLCVSGTISEHSFATLNWLSDLHRVGSIVECAWDFWRGLSALSRLESNIQFLPRFIPFLVTNVIATALIGTKALQYHREIKGSLGLFTQRSQVETVLLLLLESGVACILFWVIGFVLVSVVVHNQFSDARIFTGVYHHIAGIYPTCVLFVAIHGPTESLRSAHVSQALRFASPSETREGGSGANYANDYQPRDSVGPCGISLQDLHEDALPDASVRSGETTRGLSESPVASGTESESVDHRKGPEVRSTEGSFGI
ncbi:hypothetical protein GGG16DRAFT_44103 [Schizophyllum commune]|nr:hypothetical protein K525DRAFT_202549 [Schizophyllum commune Loenen D]